VFTLEDVLRIADIFYKVGLTKSTYTKEDVLECIQQSTEIEVEIMMKRIVDETKTIGAVKGVKGSGDKITTYKSIPKLDDNGCLILKRAK
jgi:hypothetical protein